MGRKTPLRIAITGPESTGKSQLAKQLAETYSESWVPEFSREYLALTDGKYEYKDILAIAKGQYKKELAALKTCRRILFCDTDFLVTFIWEKVRFGKTHKWIRDNLSALPYDYTLLCNTDLPWEYDPLRENPNDRELLYNLYLHELNTRNISYAIIKGTGDERLQNAIKALRDSGLLKNWE
ncbi:MAG TPA: ATP-binding protein [Lentimicrobium sp.]|nr:ATP-binding protein [Lentimicrobium sp.]